MISFRHASQQYHLEFGQLWVDSTKDENTPLFRDTSKNDVYLIISKIKKGVPWRDAVNQLYGETHPWLDKIVTSNKRDLFLRKFPTTKGAKVLDIGAGWGQYSIPLAKTCEVTALEPTPERLAFIKAAAEQEGVANRMHFVEGSFLEVDLDTKFDYVFCIGVLEWVPVFAEGNPRETQLNFLRRMRGILAEGGKLVLGIENRIGLKYVLGADDDHIGLPNIATYDATLAAEKLREETGRELRSFTFTRGELDKLLEEAGFEKRDFFGAFPDYKLPDEILPMGHQIEQFLSKGYNITEHLGTDGSPVKIQRELASHYETFANLGIASEFAPSFFVEASPTNHTRKDELVEEALLRHGVITSDRKYKLKQYPMRHHRRDRLTKFAYQVCSEDEGLYFLTVSKDDLSDLYQRSLAFAQACPDLACKPLFCFYDKETDLHLLGTEFFKGESLDERVTKNSCDAKTWSLVVEKVEEKLEHTAQVGTQEEMEGEWNEIWESIEQSAGLDSFDLAVINSWLKPKIQCALAELPLRKRWTNGDLHGGNILWDGAFQCRLVDLELAGIKYFPELDRHFVSNFSNMPKIYHDEPLWKAELQRPIYQAMFWLRHWQMVNRIMQASDAIKAAEVLLPKIIHYVQEHLHDHSVTLKKWIESEQNLVLTQRENEQNLRLVKELQRHHIQTESCVHQESSQEVNRKDGSQEKIEIENLKHVLSIREERIHKLENEVGNLQSKLLSLVKKLKRVTKENLDLRMKSKKVLREVESWNRRSWFTRAFHRLRIKNKL